VGSKKTMNKISVIIPAYNAVATVEKTVRNVLASTIPVDVWVVDLARWRNEVEVDNGGCCILRTRADVESKFVVPHLIKGQGASFIWNKLYHYAATVGSATHSYGARQFNDFKACARFRKEHGVPSARWYCVNLRSAIVAVLRSNLAMATKCYWVAKLLGEKLKS